LFLHRIPFEKMVPQIKLYQANHFEALWHGAIRAWFEQACSNSWRQSEPTAVLVPSRSFGFFLKSRLVESGDGFASIPFWTPGECRAWLLDRFPDTRQGRRGRETRPLASRENLHLMLAVAAEQQTPLSTLAQAVAKDPSSLMRCLDQVSSAGWDHASGLVNFEEIGGKSLISVAASFSSILEKSGYQTIQEADDWLSKQVIQTRPILSSILVIGFHGAHWPFWRLLNTIVNAAQQAVVCLSQPRYHAEKIDQLWIGSWEENFQPATQLPEPDTRPTQPFSVLADKMQTGSHGKTAQSVCEGSVGRAPLLDKEGLGEVELRGGPPVVPLGKGDKAVTKMTFRTRSQKKESSQPQVIFHIGRNIREQARAIVAQTLAFLSDPGCSRLGIIFPGYGALSREVAALLAGLKIPHNDALGHFVSGAPESTAFWQSWLTLQRRPRIGNFIRFLRACPRTFSFFHGNHQNMEKVLRQAFHELLVDDLPVLIAYLKQSVSQEDQAVGAFVESWPILPDTATMAEFMVHTRMTLDKLGLSEQVSFILEYAGTLTGSLKTALSRHIFLNWLSEVNDSRQRTRDEWGKHPFARAQILPCMQAEGQSWSHLILAGLNEGEWPPRLEPSGLLNERTIDQLNSKALRVGSQGQCHVTVRSGRGICLGPFEQHLLAQRQFYDLIESVEAGLCVCASMTNESISGRSWAPGEFLTKLYFVECGQPLSDETMAQLQDNTANWIRSSYLFGAVMKPDDPSIRQTRSAYQARRDGSKPFGKYEFALKSRPKKAIILPCKEWERALKHPSEIWLKRVLGVEPDSMDFDEDRWPLAIGTWVHHWLKCGVYFSITDETSTASAKRSEFVPFPEENKLVIHIQKAAHHTRQRITQAFEDGGRTVPSWWIAGWRKAVWIANQLATGIHQIQPSRPPYSLPPPSRFPCSLPPDWSMMAAEFSLPHDLAVPIHAGHILRLNGQMDLLLAKNPPGDPGRPLAGSHLWVVDFKTGSSEPLSKSKLAKGNGVQIALYALALRSLGATRVTLSISNPHQLLEPQLELEDVLSLTRLWEELCHMQDTAIFGMRGELRPEHVQGARYPLATLAVNPDILEEKWERTHSLPPEDEA